MELIVEAAIAHRIIKKKHGEGALQLRPTLLPASGSLDNLVEEIENAYRSRSGKSFGQFESDEQNYPTSANLRNHFGFGNANFVDTSHALMNTLLRHAGGANLATGGNVLMAHVKNGQCEWFVVTILTDKVSAAIDDKLNLVDSVHLDLAGMRFAGRVDITQWLKGEDRYVSFLKGGSGEVSDYFQSFLGCRQPTEVRAETNNLKNVIQTVIEGIDATDERRDAAQRECYNYLKECADSGLPMSIDVLCNRAWPENPSLLKLPLTAEEAGISDGLVPHKKALEGLIRFEGKGPQWKLAFDRSAVAQKTIELDAENKVMTIKNVPDEFIERFQNDFKSTTQ